MDLINPLIGGMMIGLAAALLMKLHGRVAGVSGILAGIFSFVEGEWLWRVLFIAGLCGGGLLIALFWPEMLPQQSGMSLPLLLGGGFLVGLGTRLGSGCTSGHGVCGLARFSKRSLVATIVFMGMGFVTVYVVRGVLA